jgi:hypothetical protein
VNMGTATIDSDQAAMQALALSASTILCAVCLLAWLEMVIIPAEACVIAVGLLSAFALIIYSKGSLLVFFRSVAAVFLLGLVLGNLGETLILGLLREHGPELLQDLLGSLFGTADPFNLELVRRVEEYRQQANLVASGGIAAFIAGMCVVGLLGDSRGRGTTATKTSGVEYQRKASAIFWVTAGFFAVFVAETIRLGRIAGIYSGIGDNTRLMITSMQLALSGCVLCAAYLQRDAKGVIRFCVLLGVIYAFIAFLGWRGQSFAFLGAAFVSSAWYLRRIRKIVVVCIFVGVACLWWIVDATRLDPFAERNYVAAINEVQGEIGKILVFPLVLITSQELSLRYSMLFVEDQGVGKGKWYTHYVSFMLPNVAGDARDPEVEEGQSLAITVTQTYVQTFGIGFTPIAEAYANFGFTGTVLVLFFLGLFLTRLETWVAGNPSPERLVVLGMVGAGCFWWLRNDSMQLGRFILWGLALHWMMCAWFDLRGTGMRSSTNG